MVKLQDEFDVVVDWRGFELHPETPRGGMSVASFFPGESRREEFRNYMQQFAANHGVPMGQPSHIPNTRRALAMTEYARENGKLEQFRDATMAAHWFDGKDIEADNDLAALAKNVGLDPVAALKAADDRTYLDRVDAIRAEAQEYGVTSIPTFFLGSDDHVVVGCQPYESIRKRAQIAGLKRVG